MSLGTLSLFAIVPALLGMYAGQHMRRRISVATFQILLFVGLMLLGASLLIKYLM